MNLDLKKDNRFKDSLFEYHIFVKDRIKKQWLPWHTTDDVRLNKTQDTLLIRPDKLYIMSYCYEGEYDQIPFVKRRCKNNIN